MQYMLIDSANPPHTAVVDVIRDLILPHVEWKLVTPGAFGGVGAGDKPYPALNVSDARPFVQW
jgi:hypothetical protein